MKSLIYIIASASIVLFTSVQLDRNLESKRVQSLKSSKLNGSINLNPRIYQDSIPSDVLTGQTIFDISCQRWHINKISYKYDADSWIQVAERMSSKAALDSIEWSNLTAYILWELPHTYSSLILKTNGMSPW